MGGIKVPLAIDDLGILTRIDDATRGKDYYCPACNMPVIVRKGDIKIHHFAHKASDFCSQETVIHKTAKMLFQKLVSDWKNGLAQAPKINRKCQICQSIIQQPLPDKVQSAELEVPLQNGSIVDIVLLDVEEKILAGIEVRVTHKVNFEKSESLPIPFIEIDGYEFVENPNEINVLLDKFNPFTCKECKERLSKYISKAKMVAEQCNIDLPISFYRYGISVCWACKKQILVFAWPDHPCFSTTEPTKEPRPRTIQWRYSNTIKSEYWANCCPFCNRIQGDFFLFNTYDSPFFGLDEGEDNKKDFDHDMLFIANLDRNK